MTALARHDDLVTSQDAADGMTEHVAVCEKLVLLALTRHGPLTTHEIAKRTGMAVVTVSPRIKPLRDRGFVRATGERRLGRSVWALVDKPTP